MNQLSGKSAISSKEFFFDTVKSIQHSPSPKTLGGAANTELASWYEEAHAYYQNVQSGQENMPDASTWNEFLNQMRWAYDQLIVQTGPAWDPMNADNPNVNTGTQAVADPFGGFAGTSGNWVHTHETTRVGFNGNEKRDIWSNEIDLDVAPLSAKVQVAKVLDESLEPPEEVLKVMVKDSATGQQAVWVIHDFEDANIRINVPDVKNQVEDLTGLNPSPISVAKFKEGSMGPQNPIANVPGTPIEDRENATLYEAYADETIEFRLDGYGVEGEVQTGVVFGKTVIFTRQTDIVEVDKNAEGATVVTVNHRDGSQDIVEVQKGYEVQLFAREETLTVDGQAFGDLVGIPEAYDDLLQVNPVKGEDGGQASPSFNPEDTPPDRVEAGVAYYNTKEIVSLKNNYENDIQEFDITTGGTFELSANNYDDKVRITIMLDGSYQIRVSDPSGEKVREYLIKGPPEEILLEGFLPGQVTVNRSHGNGSSGIFNFGEGVYVEYKEEDYEALARIRLDSPGAKDIESILQGESGDLNANENIQQMDHFLSVAGKNWDQLLAALGSAGLGSFQDVEALKEAVSQGSFPPSLNSEENIRNMVRLMFNLDSQFATAVTGANHWDGTLLADQYQRGAERLSTLLSALYSGHNISPYLGYADKDNWRSNNQIVINGTAYNFTKEEKGHTHELEVSMAS